MSSFLPILSYAQDEATAPAADSTQASHDVANDSVGTRQPAAASTGCETGSAQDVEQQTARRPTKGTTPSKPPDAAHVQSSAPQSQGAASSTAAPAATAVAAVAKAAPKRPGLKSALKKTGGAIPRNVGGAETAAGAGEEDVDLEKLYPEITPEMALEVRRRRAAFTSMLALLERGAHSEQELAVAAAPLSGAELLQVAEERALAGKCGSPLCPNSVDAAQAGRARMVLAADDVSRVEWQRFCSSGCERFVAQYAAQLGDPMMRLRAEAKQQILSHAPRGSKPKVAAQVNGVTTMLADVAERDPAVAAAEAAAAAAKLSASQGNNVSNGSSDGLGGSSGSSEGPKGSSSAAAATAVEGYVPGTAKTRSAGMNHGLAYVVGGSGAQRAVPAGATAGGGQGGGSGGGSGARVSRNLAHLVTDVSAPGPGPATAASRGATATSTAPAVTATAATATADCDGSGGGSRPGAGASEAGDGDGSTSGRTLAAPAALRSSLKRTSSSGGQAAGGRESDSGGVRAIRKNVSFAEEDQVQEYMEHMSQRPETAARNSSSHAAGAVAGAGPSQREEPLLVFTLNEEEGDGQLVVGDPSTAGTDQDKGRGGLVGTLQVAGAGEGGLQTVTERVGDGEEEGGPYEGGNAGDGQQQGQIPRALKLWFPAAAGGLGVALPKGDSKNSRRAAAPGALKAGKAPAAGAGAGNSAQDAANRQGSTDGGQGQGVPAASTCKSAGGGPSSDPTATAGAPGSAAAGAESQAVATQPATARSGAAQAAVRKFMPNIPGASGARRQVVRLDGPPGKPLAPDPVARVNQASGARAAAGSSPAAAPEARADPAATSASAGPVLASVMAPATTASPAPSRPAPAVTVHASKGQSSSHLTVRKSMAPPRPPSSSSVSAAAGAASPTAKLPTEPSSLIEVLPFEDPLEVAQAAGHVPTPVKVIEIKSDKRRGPAMSYPSNGMEAGGGEGGDSDSDVSDQEEWCHEGRGRGGRGQGAATRGAREEDEGANNDGNESEEEWSDQDGEFGGAEVRGRGRRGRKGEEEEEEEEEESQGGDDAGAGSGYSSDQDPNYASAAPFFGPPPKGFRVTLSPYNELWSLLSDWATQETIEYVTAPAATATTASTAAAGRRARGGVERFEERGEGEEGRNGEGDGAAGDGGSTGQGVTGAAARDSADARDVLAALPPPSAHLAHARSALAELLTPHVSQLSSELRVRVPASDISKRVTGVLSTLVLRGPVPSLQAAQWRMLALALLRALALNRLPGLRDAFEGEGAGGRLEGALRGMGFGLPHLSALVDLLVSVT